MSINHLFKPYMFITELPDLSSKLHLYQVKLLLKMKELSEELCMCLLRGTILFTEYIPHLAFSQLKATKRYSGKSSTLKIHNI